MRHDTQGDAETNRLPWAGGYGGEFACLCRDARAMRFISGGVPLTDEMIDAITRRFRALRDEYGYAPGPPSSLPGFGSYRKPRTEAGTRGLVLLPGTRFS